MNGGFGSKDLPCSWLEQLPQGPGILDSWNSGLEFRLKIPWGIHPQTSWTFFGI
jgi:hypothetical protein